VVVKKEVFVVVVVIKRVVFVVVFVVAVVVVVVKRVFKVLKFRNPVVDIVAVKSWYLLLKCRCGGENNCIISS